MLGVGGGVTFSSVFSLGSGCGGGTSADDGLGGASSGFGTGGASLGDASFGGIAGTR